MEEGMRGKEEGDIRIFIFIKEAKNIRNKICIYVNGIDGKLKVRMGKKELICVKRKDGGNFGKKIFKK
ncbi:unnamed protein product [Meloidogyne enterolobii]|uniref:Uncharacterized protein n=1 Tax=Meloidogyne enterolobii TaxID=390850 RepID=A0ACB0YVD1_MELEN